MALRRPILCGLLLTGWGFAQSQAYQANTPEEFDAYLDVLEAATPENTIAAARTFTRRFPNSELLVPTLDLELSACLRLGDIGCVIRNAEAILAKEPRHARLLAVLAGVWANQAQDEEGLRRAEHYAREALKAIERLRVSRKVSLEQYLELRARLTADARAALGHIAFKRGDISGAVQQLESAVKLVNPPEPAHSYRLGLLYGLLGRSQEAAECFRAVVERGSAELQALARERLASLPR